ncbi:hypothetical protein ACIQXV_10570 [Neobacillus sp. NPDC097160]|uniref:hypothetical protein n=1 Tax=Neobacillus sp. NPDC097160 TaxID=3364298 RepID=UPI0037FA8646
MSKNNYKNHEQTTILSIDSDALIENNTQVVNELPEIQQEQVDVFSELKKQLANSLFESSTQLVSSLSEIQSHIASELSAIRLELLTIKEENTKLLDQITYIEQNYKVKKKKK